ESLLPGSVRRKNDGFRGKQDRLADIDRRVDGGGWLVKHQALASIAVQSERMHAGRELDHLEGRRVTRIDFDRPGYAVAQDAVDAEQSAQAAGRGEHVTELDEGLVLPVIECKRPDAATVMKR